MEPHLPPAPAAAYHHPPATTKAPIDIGYQYSEKDVYDHRLQYAPRVERGSKGSGNSRAHDSVISYPRSPNVATASPPSPVSSVSSGRKHRSQQSARHSHDAISTVSPPARAHVDPEKADSSPHRSRSSGVASNPDVTRQTIAYDDFDDKGPEDKPVQLLVCAIPASFPCTIC
jgi:hypothetical protein